MEFIDRVEQKGAPVHLLQRPDGQDSHHALQIVGQDVEAHLRSDLVEGPDLEVGRSRPGLERTEGGSIVDRRMRITPPSLCLLYWGG